MIDGFTIALLKSELGQVIASGSETIAYNFVILGLQNRIRLLSKNNPIDKMLYEKSYNFVSPGLQNCIRLWTRANIRQHALRNTIQLCKPGAAKSHMTLEKSQHQATCFEKYHTTQV